MPLDRADAPSPDASRADFAAHHQDDLEHVAGLRRFDQANVGSGYGAIGTGHEVPGATAFP